MLTPNLRMTPLLQMRRVLREAGLPLSDEEDEEDDNDRCVLDEEGWQEAAR